MCDKNTWIAEGLPPEESSWEAKVEAAWKIVRAGMPEAKDWKHIEVSCQKLSYYNKLIPFNSTACPSRDHFVRGDRSFTPIEFPNCCGIGYIQSWADLRATQAYSPLRQAGFILWCDAMKRYCLYGLIFASVVEDLLPQVPPLLKYCGWTRGGGGINHVHDYRVCAIWCFVVHEKRQELEKW